MNIVEAVFQKTKIFNFFLMRTTLHFEGRTKKREREREKEKRTGNICKGTPDIEFEQDWSIGLAATLHDRQKIKKYISSFKDFPGKSRWCHIVGLRMYYKYTKFEQNR